MTPTIHQLPEPANYASAWWERTALDEDDLSHLPPNVAEVWYWYVRGDYEGSGYLLARLESGDYQLISLGHCSCFGPEEDMPKLHEGRPFHELFQDSDNDLLKTTNHLFEAARKDLP